jgi:SpoIIAA-like
MSMLEQVPAMRRLEVDRANLSAFDVVGHVSSADVENLFGLLEAAYALHPRVDVLLRLIDVEEFDWDDVAADTMKQGKAAAREHIVRCAVIGTSAALSAAHGLFLDTSPVEYKEFSAEEEQAAWEWIGGALKS